MTSQGESAFTLRSHDDDALPPALTGVEAHGRIDGVLFTLTLRQTYLNAGPDPLEVVYSFPLPAGAVLLGMAAEFEGKRLEGQVLARQRAEARYEQALERGDAPLLLEAASDGICTASLGNLNPGETVTLQVRLGQLLAFERGRLRVVVPTTIAPRYGDPLRAGLQPHQATGHSLAAEYPLAVSLTVAGSLARGRIDCPTHAHRVEPCAEGLRLELAPAATLDRDLVVVLTPAEPRPDLLLLAQDAANPGAPAVALAAFAVPARPERAALVLRLLVDCSGSMGGDSIASARAALHGVLAGLTADDEASLTRFGSGVRHVIGAGPCTEAHCERLRRAIDDTEASMGGTEMRQALEAVFAAWPRRSGGHDAGRTAGVDVLLITDGEVWQSAELVQSARRSGHRVFAIGVGSAPAESVLRELAEATGGAAEFVTPGEAVQQAAARMLARMRQEPLGDVAVDWGTPPAWQLPLPRLAFGGDTLLAMAGFAPGGAPQGPVRLLGAQHGAQHGAEDGGESAEIARIEAVAAVPGAELPRIAATRRLQGAGEAEALQLALDYQLVTRLTHCVLVHERADEDRSTRAARLQQVPSMLAAGWGATGRVLRCVAAPGVPFDLATPSVWRRQAAPDASFGSAALSGTDSDDIEIPSFLRRKGGSPSSPTLRKLMRRVVDFLAGGGSVADLVVLAQDWKLSPVLRPAFAETDALGVGRSRAWLVLALWVAGRPGPEGDTEAAAKLEAHAAGVDAGELEAARAVFERRFAGVPSDAWQPKRVRRLAKALARLP